MQLEMGIPIITIPDPSDPDHIEQLQTNEDE
ncbi:MAG: hypothetical protein ACI8RZ_005258 [Myxococcota bacterium]